MFMRLYFFSCPLPYCGVKTYPVKLPSRGHPVYYGLRFLAPAEMAAGLRRVDARSIAIRYFFG